MPLPITPTRPRAPRRARTARTLPAALLLAIVAACGGGGSAEAQKPQPLYKASITTTRHGVPHIKADDFGSLGFGAAHAYAQQNFCLLADQIVTVNGERSKHFGGNAQTLVSFVPIPNRQADFFYKAYLDDTALKQAFEQTSAEVKQLVAGYIAGYNEYLGAAVAGTARNGCDGQPWVRAITQKDFLRLLGDKAILASGAAFAQAIVSAAPPVSTVAREPSASALRKLNKDVVLAQLSPHYTRGAASNAYAIGRDATGNGAGMLLGNPHWPWFGSNQFFEVHMTVPGRFDVFGAMNGDFPVPIIGFNKDVAWTHTVSPTLRHSLYQLELVPGHPTRYRVDGQERDMVAREVSIEVRSDSGGLSTETATLYSSHLGPILNAPSLVPGGVSLRWTSTQAFSLRDANANSLRMLEQWLRIGQARNVDEIKQAAQEIGALPYVHTVAADKHGKVLYADVGAVPNLERAQFATGASGCVRGATAQAILALVNLPILDGSRSNCDWGVDPASPRPGLMPTAQQPTVERQDYVANSNQSAWMVHPQARIDDLHPVFGTATAPLSLRQRLGFTQVQQRLAGIDGLPGTGFNDLDLMRQILFGNRLMAAELAREPLTATCSPDAGHATKTVAASNGTLVDIAPACQLLGTTWDGRANPDSRGAVLFREFWRRLRMPAGTPLWLTPFDPADPVHTPRDLNTQPGPALDTLHRTLADTLLDLTAKGVDPTRPLGELQGVTRAGQRIPLHGGDEFEGAFNKLTMRQNNTSVPLTAAGYTDVFAGASYIQAVTWVDGTVQAQGLSAYSQSSDPASPHHADQTALVFGQKRFAKLPFSEADIAAEQIGATRRLVSRQMK